jgi:HAD superfamily hydrolase (TIGR01509 family)
MDGVLYDSMPRHSIAWHETMESEGITMSKSDAYLYEGMRGVETISLLFKRQKGIVISEERAQQIYDKKSKSYGAQGKAPKMDGVEDLMRQMHADGLKICVVTGSGQHSMLERLEHDLPGLVTKELMVTAFDVTRGKPNPEPYIKGMEKCGVQPWETIVVENAPLGVQAAVGARCFTIAVNTGPLPDKMLQDAGADLILPTMQMLSDCWHELLSTARL